MSFYIPTKRVDKPCEECGTSPALEYEIAGVTGVLCESCLSREIEIVNRAIEATKDKVNEQQN